MYIGFSRTQRFHGKADRRRRSHSAASLSNAVRGSAGCGPNFHIINSLGALDSRRYGVACRDAGQGREQERKLCGA